jgi:hypothetical protein
MSFFRRAYLKVLQKVRRRGEEDELYQKGEQLSI